MEKQDSINIETHARENSNAKIKNAKKYGAHNWLMLSYGLKVILKK
jgi:hypothetical protein